MYTYTSIYTHLYIHIYTYKHAYIYTLIHIYNLHTHIHIQTYAHMHIYIYIYIYIYALTHKATYSRIIPQVWKINKKRQHVSYSKFNTTIRTIRAIFFGYHHLLILKIILSNCLPSWAIHSWSFHLIFGSTCFVLASGVAVILYQIKSFNSSVVCSLYLKIQGFRYS